MGGCQILSRFKSLVDLFSPSGIFSAKREQENDKMAFQCQILTDDIESYKVDFGEEN